MNKEFEKGMMIESKDDIVTIDSMVCISPFNIETGEWTMGLMIITSMKDALEDKKNKYCQKHFKCDYKDCTKEQKKECDENC